MVTSHYAQQFTFIQEQNLQIPVTFYDERNLTETLDVLVQGFTDQTQIYYALKSCYNPHVLRVLSTRGLGVEVMSELGYDIAQKYGFKSILLNGMGRSYKLLTRVVTDGNIIIVDSIKDLEALSEIANTSSREIKIGFRLRLNFKEPELINSYVAQDHPLGNHLESEFFDTFIELCKTNPNVTWAMIHTHVTINEISSDIYIRAIGEIQKVITGISNIHKITPKIVNIGGGYEVYSPQDKQDYIDTFTAIKNAAESQLGDYALAIEPGRYLTAYAGYTIGKILDNKLINQKNWVVTDIGTNILIPIPNARYKLGYPITPNDGQIIAGITDGITSPSNNIIDEVTLDEVPVPGSFICIENTGAYTDVYSTFWAYSPHIVCWINSAGNISIYRDENDIHQLQNILFK